MGPAFWNRLIASAVLLLCLGVEARAQYFGRNKVQYDRTTVRVLTTEHFDIYYSQEDAAAAVIAGRLAERWHARLAKVFDHALRGRQPIVLYGSHRRFEQTNVYRGLIEETTGGFTDSRKRRIVLPFAGSLAETDHVLGHEIVHAFQFDISDQYRSPLAVPLWFVEGMAEYLTLGADDPQTAIWMRDAVRSNKLPSIADLASARYFPYRWGAAVWSQLVQQFGEDVPAKALRAKRDVRRRLRAITGRSLDELSAAWHAALREKYATGTASADGVALISSRSGGGRLNLAASLSPDGTRIMFLSERDQFSMDLFLADAATGRTLRKLITTATNAEFESLQYLNSAGAWDPAGSRFALATIKAGKPVLLVLGVDRPQDQREVPLADVDEIYSPTWSPDGQRLAFSAVRGGVTDLFVLNLATDAVRRLTDDAYADLQPAWSPDGRTIAFTSDRFTTNLVRLTFGAYRIALVDVDSGTISAVPAIDGSQFDPAWSPDGASLYFVGDPDSRSNVYRMDRSDARVFRLTDTDTGISGVTRTGPVLSVSSGTGALAFNVFRNGAYEIHTLTDADGIGGTLLDSASPSEGTGDDSSSTAAAEIQPVSPLPALAGDQTPHSYRPRLSLEAIGSPYFSAGGGPVGGYVSGGGSLLFGDLLGDHQLMTAVYLSSRFDESAFGAIYISRKSRVNWGVTLEQIPELRLRTMALYAEPERAQVVTRERERTLWTNRRLGGFAAYPLTRSHRVELSAGFTELSFAREGWRDLVSTLTGMTVEHQTFPLSDEPSIGMADAGLALVGDSAISGATGPMIGSRYRFQATANVGGLSYTSVLADYRRYLMPIRPYTIALRFVHAGRYGADAADFRLHDSYLGSPTLVRGYSSNNVVRRECRNGTADCPTLNTLLANRIVAAKLEVRVPLWSTITSTSRIRYGPLPVDAFLFADAGAGWGGEQRFGPGGFDGRIVRSVGAGIRANAAGFVLELAAVRPFDLRGAGWTFGFNLRPGF
jgi:hypothetical protein